MNGWIYACLAVGLLLLATPAGALMPDDITLSTDKIWLTAGNGGTSTVTVNVTNGSGAEPVPGAAVYLAVDAAYGSISPARVVTGSNGTATATFRHGTRSGTATITATVSDEELVVPLTRSVEQQIDHAAPHKIANLWYESEVTAGETTDITVRMVDRYGNVVDNQNVAEKVMFRVGAPAGFVNGTSCPDEISVPVDVAGNTTVTLRADTVAGEHLVYIQPPAPVVGAYISIFGVAGLPFSITTAVDHDAAVPADGKTKFSFTYTLFDEYGNPSGGKGLWVNASTTRVDRPDETYSRLLASNSRGEVMITYGPEDSVGSATLIATALGNDSVTSTTQVQFTSTAPVNMLLSANPQSMPSGEIQPGFVAELRAKVMDVKGNPVAGETVTFTLDNDSINVNGYNTTGKPYLNEGNITVSSETDANGFAIVEFHPGKFVKLEDNKTQWSPTARGTATVWARWKNAREDITLTWMNYPYLSVETEVSPDTVAVNETVDVKIRLKGDGYKLEPDPIDVVLVMDQSGSMRYNINHVNNNENSNERMIAARNASKTFVGQMNSTRGDRVGLISFNSSTTRKNSLNNSFNEVNASLNGLKPDGATQLRRGIYEAIHMQNQAKHQDNAIKAVIVMTDGDWNKDGSLLARGTGLKNWSWSGNTITDSYYEYYDGLGGTLKEEMILVPKASGSGYDYKRQLTEYCSGGEETNQNMSRFASDSGVKLYTITFAYNPGDTVNETMRILANATGGFYEHAGDGAQLTNIYERIAGELKTEAGINTTMDLAFKNINVTGIDVPGTEVFDYVYSEGNSTYIYNRTGTVDHFKKTINQTDDWNNIQNLNFDIGTVRLGQTWEATFRLKVKMEGNINVFGNGSTISFNDGKEKLELPDTFITAVADLNNTGLDFQGLNITNLRFTGTEPVDEYLPVAWDLNYTGLYDVTEDVFYSNDNEYTWVRFDALTATNQTTNGTSALDVRGLPPGEYIIRVRGSAPDTADAFAKIVQYVTAGATGDAYIRIK